MKCQHPHAHTSSDGWDIPDDALLGVMIKTNGLSVYKMRCSECGKESSPIPTSMAEKMMADDGKKVTWMRGPSWTPPQCEVDGCTAPGGECHHWAPWNVFGSEAIKWPTAQLCRDHHREWHDRMDGYRRNEKGK